MKEKTSMVLILAAIVVIAGVIYLTSSEDSEPSDTLVQYFSEEMREFVVNKNGAHPIEGFEPVMFLDAFPGLEERDFDQVEALQGIYYLNEGVEFNLTVSQGEIHTAARAISDEGMKNLLENIEERLGRDIETKEDVDNLIAELSK